MSSYPWKFYEKSVGLWAIESNHSVYQFPLQTKGLDIDGVAREYFHYFDAAMAAMDDLFKPTAIHYPPGRPVIQGPMPFMMEEAKERLLQIWKDDAKSCELWAPGALVLGLTSVTVCTDDRLANVELPELLRVMFIAMPGTDRYTLALVTNADIWLERTIDGTLNDVGIANSAKLSRALDRLALAMDGKVTYYKSECDNVAINERGFAQ